MLLPAQWQRRQDLGLTLTVAHRAAGRARCCATTTANRDAIVDYRWGLAIGDEFLSEADLQSSWPGPRCRWCGCAGAGCTWTADRLRGRAGVPGPGRAGQMTAGEALRLVRLLSPEGDLPLPVTGVDGTGWLADLLAGRAVRAARTARPARVAAPRRCARTSARGLSWLAFLDGLGVGALLADDMGLGKTVQLLALEALLRDRGPRPPTLDRLPAVGAGQLAARDRAVHARAAGRGAPRRRPGAARRRATWS